MIPEKKKESRDLVLTVCGVNMKKHLPAICGHTSVVLPQNNILIFGGANTKKITNETYIFDITKLGWKRLAQPSHLALPALFGHSATLVNNDRGEDHVFVFGGLTPGSGDASRTESKEKTTKKMTSGSLGLRRKLLKFIKGKEELCNTLYSFEVESQDWKEVQASSAVKEQDTPAARYFHAACAIDQSIYLYGGCTESNFGGSSDELWCFNTSTNTWKKISTIGEQPPALHGHSMTVIDHQTILLFGGSTDNAASRLSNDAYLLKTEGMVWSKLQTTGSPPFPRSFHTASIVRSASNPDEKLLYIFAGETYNVSSDLCALNLSNGLYKWSRPLFDSAFEHLLHSAVVVSDKLLVYGGLSFNQGYLADFFFVNTVSIRPGKTKNDHTFKLVLIGDSGVGKSCLMTRFVEDHFSDVHISTIGVDFKTVTTMVDGKIVKLHVWDTAGQERFANVTTHYYRNCDGAIVVYDVTNKDSFDAVDNWVDAVEAANGDGAVTLLFVGNKNDLADERQVSRKDGQLMAQRFSAPFIETSAKSSANVDITFLNLSKKLVRKKKSLAQREKKSSSSKKTGHVLLTDSNASAQDGEHTKCCK